MQTLIFDEIDSSSSELRRQLAGQVSDLPLAVLAKRQRSGRGRLGRSWTSPEGNLYLSIALPIDLEREQHRLALSLRVGAVLAFFLEQNFAIRCGLKWPNDLVLQRKKLAGILCETMNVQRGPQQVTVALIGIGLNVHVAPLLEDRATTSLATVLPDASLDVESLARRFLADFVQQVESFNSTDLQRYLIDKGHPVFYLDRQRWFLFAGLDARGAMLLQPMTMGGTEPSELESIESSHESLKWPFLAADETNPPYLLADIGNSHVKLAVVQASKDTPEFRLLADCSYQDEQSLHEALQGLEQDYALPQGWPVFTLSVNRQHQNWLKVQLKQHGLTLAQLTKRPLLVDFSTYDFSRLGADRVALCEAAVRECPKQNLVVAGFGTALTVEVISKDRKYQGGWILPGLQQRLDILAGATDQLPKLTMSTVAGHWQAQAGQRIGFGHNTESAIAYGLRAEVFSLLQSLRAYLSDQSGAGEPWQLILTGGQSSYVSPLFPEAKLIPNLALRGAVLIALTA